MGIYQCGTLTHGRRECEIYPLACDGLMSLASYVLTILQVSSIRRCPSLTIVFGPGLSKSIKKIMFDNRRAFQGRVLPHTCGATH